MKLKDLLNNFVHIYESPQVVDDEDWGLGTAERNAKVLEDLMKSPGTREIGSYRGLKLYRLRGVFFAVDPQSPVQLVYRIKTEVVKISSINDRAVIQRELWRDVNNVSASGLTAHIFKKLLLPEFHIIASDNLQTKDGRAFWMNRVSEAFDQNKHVYVLHELPPRKLIRVLDHAEFMKLNNAGQIWGTEPKDRLRRVIIADHLLTPRKDVELDD